MSIPGFAPVPEPRAPQLGARRAGARFVPFALVLAVAVAAVAAIAAVAAAAARSSLAPELRYRHPPASSERALDALEREIAVYRQRSLERPGDGLDLAALADAYLGKARVSGFAPWYLLAEQTARRSLANLPFDNPGAQLVLAEVAGARHAFGEALELADAVLAERPGNARALTIRATAQLARGDLAAAAGAAEALVATRPTPASLGLLGAVRGAQARDAEAIAALRNAIALEERGDARTSAWLRTGLGRLQLRRGRPAEAAPLLAEALRIVPDYEPARLELAAARLALGRARAAERSYAALLRGDAAAAATTAGATTTDHAALLGLARSRAARGDRGGAEALWRRAETALRADRERNAFGHDRELARLLLERGRPEDAPEALELLRTERARRGDAETLDLLAWALTRSGDADGARAVAAEALAAGATPAALERAAQVAAAAGDDAAAARQRTRLAALAPGFDARVSRALGRSDPFPASRR